MRAAREHGELTQRELALKLGVEVGTVRRAENGVYVRPERIVAWAFACGVDAGWLQWNVDACSQADMHFDFQPRHAAASESTDIRDSALTSGFVLAVAA